MRNLLLALLAVGISHCSFAEMGYTASKNEQVLLEQLVSEQIDFYLDGKPSLFTYKNYRSVSAVNLTKEYKANFVRADSNYKNVNIIISGDVAKIKRSFSERPYVILNAGLDIKSPRLNFLLPEEYLVADLDQGQKARFLCKGDGVNLLGAPVLIECNSIDEIENGLKQQVKRDMDKLLAGDTKNNDLINELAFTVKKAAILSNDFSHCKAIDAKCLRSSLKKKANQEQTEQIELYEALLLAASQ